LALALILALAHTAAAPVPGAPAVPGATTASRAKVAAVPEGPAAPAEAPRAKAPADPPALPPATPGHPFVLASDLFAATLPGAHPTEVRMGSDYVLGSGDQVALTTFGSVAVSRVLTVDRGGKLAIPDVGILDVSGLKLAAARTLVRAAFHRKYSGLDQFSMEVVAIHDVQVFVLGEVKRPGSYLLPSTSSPVTLLGLAGGPGENGSYRRVQHIRAGKVLQTLDLYRLRFQGLGLDSRGFLDGDTLFVPLAGLRIRVEGAFRRVAASGPLLMELTQAERAVDAVALAGGLIPAASRTLLTVQRTSAGGVTAFRNISNTPAELRAAGFCEADILRALVRAERQEEYVEAAGCVAVPGRFSFRPGMRVRDLLTQGEQVLPATYRLRGEVLRTHPDGRTQLLCFDVDGALRGEAEHNLALAPRDRVELGRVADLRLPRRVTILGPLTRPGVYDWHEGMRASDLVYRAGVPKLSADSHYAELAHLRDGKTSAVVRLDLAALVSTETRSPGAAQDAVNPVLQPYDQITIYENPDFRMHRTVTISGQVRRPGPYVIQEDRFTLSQLVTRAGGLTQDAMPSGGIFLRASVEARDLAGPDPVARNLDEEGRAALLGLTDLDSILKRLNETKRNKETGALQPSPLLHGLLIGAMNRMVVDFTAVLKGDARQDVVLLDGDQVFIPRQTDSVYVVGEVASSFSTFHVKPGDRVRDVLKLAGGYTRNADAAKVRLLKASGRIQETRVERSGIEPGDALLVPQKIRKDVPWQDTLLALTPLAILYNAIRR